MGDRVTGIDMGQCNMTTNFYTEKGYEKEVQKKHFKIAWIKTVTHTLHTHKNIHRRRLDTFRGLECKLKCIRPNGGKHVQQVSNRYLLIRGY